MDCFEHFLVSVATDSVFFSCAKTDISMCVRWKCFVPDEPRTKGVDAQLHIVSVITFRIWSILILVLVPDSKHSPLDTPMHDARALNLVAVSISIKLYSTTFSLKTIL